MKKFWILGVLFFLAVGYFFANLWLQNPYLSDAKIVQNNSDEMSKPVVQQVQNETLEIVDDTVLEDNIDQLKSDFDKALQESTAIQEIADPSNSDESSAEFISEAKKPWKIIKSSTSLDDVRLRGDVVPLEVVQVDPVMLKGISEGDQINLPMPDNAQQIIKVSKVKTLWNGDLSIQGTIQSDAGEIFPAVISSGKDTVFASFSTDKGSFELEAFSGVGGLYSVNEMDEKTFQPETDELLN